MAQGTGLQMVVLCKRCGDFLDGPDSACKRCGQLALLNTYSCEYCGLSNDMNTMFCQNCLSPSLVSKPNSPVERLKYTAVSPSQPILHRASVVLEGSLRYPQAFTWSSTWNELNQASVNTTVSDVLERGLRMATVVRSEADARKICSTLPLDVPAVERLRLYEFANKVHPSASWPLEAMAVYKGEGATEESELAVRQLIQERKAINPDTDPSTVMLQGAQQDVMADAAIVAGSTVAATSAAVGTAAVATGGAITFFSILGGIGLLLVSLFLGVTGMMLCVTICFLPVGAILLIAASGIGTAGMAMMVGGSTVGIGTAIGGAFAGATGTVMGAAVGVGGAVRKQNGVPRRK